MKLLNETMEKKLKIFFSIKDDDWVKWFAQENDWKDDCDKFNECCFIGKQMPKYPQHPHCQCRIVKISKPIPNITAKSFVNVQKFTDYVFDNEKNNGKKQLFEDWGIRKKIVNT